MHCFSYDYKHWKNTLTTQKWSIIRYFNWITTHVKCFETNEIVKHFVIALCVCMRAAVNTLSLTMWLWQMPVKCLRFDNSTKPGNPKLVPNFGLFLHIACRILGRLFSTNQMYITHIHFFIFLSELFTKVASHLKTLNSTDPWFIATQYNH